MQFAHTYIRFSTWRGSIYFFYVAEINIWTRFIADSCVAQALPSSADDIYNLSTISHRTTFACDQIWKYITRETCVLDDIINYSILIRRLDLLCRPGLAACQHMQPAASQAQAMQNVEGHAAFGALIY